MMRFGLIVAAIAAAACGGGGKGSDADADAPDTDAADDGTGDQDVAQDPGTDDPATDLPWDPVEEEPAGICGNLAVEPGEDCDPPGAAVGCATECGTWGTGICTESCLTPSPADCAPPDEACNLIDEDCDDLVDEGTIAAWSGTVVLRAGAGDAPVGLEWTGSGYAAVWVDEGGSDDGLDLAVVDPMGEVVSGPIAIPVSPGDVAGRPSLAWTGTSLLVAWTTAGERHAASVDLAGSLIAHEAHAAVGPGPSPSISWSGSHAALAWVEEVAGSREVLLAFVGAGCTEEAAPEAVTASASASDPDVDAIPGAVAMAWVDARSGLAQIHRAVLGHDGSVVAADASLTTTGGASSPAISAGHRLVAWTDDRDGTRRIYTVALDTSWSPVGSDAAVGEGSSIALGAAEGRIGLASGSDLLTLGADGAAEGAPLAMGLDARALAWGDIAAAAAGGSGADLVVRLAGCADHEGCDSWTGSLEPVETRTGYDLFTEYLGHDAAIEGSWTARPVTYLSIQIFQGDPYHGPTGTGTFSLTGEPYETCGLCVLLYEECSVSTCARVYLARAGTLAIDSTGGEGDVFSGTLTGAVLAEVSIDSSSRESEWVEGGLESCFGTYGFSQIIE